MLLQYLEPTSTAISLYNLLVVQLRCFVARRNFCFVARRNFAVRKSHTVLNGYIKLKKN